MNSRSNEPTIDQQKLRGKTKRHINKAVHTTHTHARIYKFHEKSVMNTPHNKEENFIRFFIN